MQERSSAASQVERLLEIMRRLRAENGCPWDREQDLRSLRPYLVEEAYEVLDEMDRVAYGTASWRELCVELGDLLFQIVFHAQLAAELGEFTFADVAQAISDKIERRHPHVFGERKVKDAEEVLDNWARLKAEEKKEKQGHEGSVLDGVPGAAPALLRAERLTEKASRIGFDWPNLGEVRQKLDEELGELDEAIARGDRDSLEHELGDVLFALANLARFIKTPPEDALRQANRRFTGRFHQIEAALRAEGIPFGRATLEQMDRHWEAAKAREKAVPPPRQPPRAPVAAIAVRVADVAQARRAMDVFASSVGWVVAKAGAGEASYTDGAMWLHLEPGGTAGGGVTFEAPSRRAVEAVAGALAEAGVAVSRQGADAIAFSAGTLSVQYRSAP
jgi:ATP diphosphatase